jgi:hypothetical protein
VLTKTRAARVSIANRTVGGSVPTRAGRTPREGAASSCSRGNVCRGAPWDKPFNMACEPGVELILAGVSGEQSRPYFVFLSRVAPRGRYDFES